MENGEEADKKPEGADRKTVKIEGNNLRPALLQDIVEKAQAKTAAGAATEAGRPAATTDAAQLAVGGGTETHKPGGVAGGQGATNADAVGAVVGGAA